MVMVLYEEEENVMYWLYNKNNGARNVYIELGTST